jgi:hypothetical protein
LDAVDRPRRDQDVCLVIDDLGHLGLIYCESDVETATVENVIGDLLGGQYSNPVRVIASTSPMDCRGIFRPMWPQSYDGAVICSSATFRRAFRILSSGTKANRDSSHCG